MRSFALAAASAAAAVVIMAAAGLAFGYSPIETISIVTRGAAGSPFAIRATVLKSVPLVLTGLAVALAFRGGVWNIGAEGQFIVGGLAALLASRFGPVASLGAAIAAGIVWASIASLMRISRGAPEVLTTILLNFVAIHLLGWSVNGPLQEARAQYPQTDVAASSLPQWGGVHAGAAIAFAAAAAAWWFLYRTRSGLHLRAAGLNPAAAANAGISVRAQIVRAMAISGGLAGLAGGIELLGVTSRLFERFASGYGYSGIAVALLAQLHPAATALAALFFGALASGAGELQRSANVSAAVATFAQGVVVLLIAASTRLGGRSD